MGSRSRLISVSKSSGFPTTWATLCLSSPRTTPTLPQETVRMRPGRGCVHRRACRYGRGPVGVPPSAPPAVWLRRLRALSRRGSPNWAPCPPIDPAGTHQSRPARSRVAAPQSGPSYDSPAPPGGLPCGLRVDFASLALRAASGSLSRCTRLPSVQNASDPLAFFDVEGRVRRRRQGDNTLMVAVAPPFGLPDGTLCPLRFHSQSP